MGATSSIPRAISEADVALRFLQALHAGRIIDALDALSPDAVIRGMDGEERRGMTAIARSLLPYRTPGRVEIVGVHRSAQGVTAQWRTRPIVGTQYREFRATFNVSGDRIRSMDFHRS